MTAGHSIAHWRRPLVVGVGAAIALVSIASPASAHDSTSGSTVLEVNDERIIATASVPFAELGYEDTSGDGLIDVDELGAQEAAVSSTIVAAVRDNVVLTIDGEEVLIIGAGVPGLSGTDDSGTDDSMVDDSTDDAANAARSEVVALMFVTGPHDGDVGEVGLEWNFSSPSREVVLSSPDAAVVGELGDDNTVAFSLGTWASASSFFALGVEHIQFGPDHLLFLVVLTLAVAGATITKSTAWRTIKLVTAFTVGHAVSLCLAYFDLISVPASVVEPAISLSIVAAAVLVLRGRTDDARPWIAGLIGLIHGLGFASSLASLGVATSQRATALAAFNVGIDVAQTAVVLMILAALWAFSLATIDRTVADMAAVDVVLVAPVRADRMAWVRIPVAAMAGVIGLAWTVTRITAVIA